jgi:hypothetical protein
MPVCVEGMVVVKERWRVRTRVKGDKEVIMHTCSQGMAVWPDQFANPMTCTKSTG